MDNTQLEKSDLHSLSSSWWWWWRGSQAGRKEMNMRNEWEGASTVLTEFLSLSLSPSLSLFLRQKPSHSGEKSCTADSSISLALALRRRCSFSNSQVWNWSTTNSQLPDRERSFERRMNRRIREKGNEKGLDSPRPQTPAARFNPCTQYWKSAWSSNLLLGRINAFVLFSQRKFLLNSSNSLILLLLRK